MTPVSTSASPVTPSLWRVRGITFVLAALAAASVVFWALKITAPAQVQVNPAALASADMARVDWAASARALGAVTAGTEAPRALAAQRWVLTGVARAGSTEGVALIAGEGQPAKPYRLKAKLEEGVYLVALELRQAHLGPTAEGPVSTTLTLPALRER